MYLLLCTGHTHTCIHTYIATHVNIHTNTHILIYIILRMGEEVLQMCPGPRGVMNPDVVLVLLWTVVAQPSWKCLGDYIGHTSEMSPLTEGQGIWDIYPSTSAGENDRKSLPGARLCRACTCRKPSEGRHRAAEASCWDVSAEGVWTPSVINVTVASFLGIFPEVVYA